MSLNTLMQQASIVLVGSFNPKIFHPQWLIDKEIIGDYDFESATGDDFVVSNDVTSYNLPDEILIQVLRNRLILKSFSFDSFITIGDMVSSIVKILPETPVYQMGLNYTIDVSGFNAKKWKDVGENLVQVDKLKDILSQNHYRDWDESNGPVSLSISFPTKTGEANVINFKISVSPRAEQYKKEEKKVLELDVNNHFKLEIKGAKQIPVIISNEWFEILENSKELMSLILNKTCGEML